MPMPKSPRAPSRRLPRRKKRAAAGLTGYRAVLFRTGCVSTALCTGVAVAQTDKSANRAKLSQPAPVNPRQTGNNTFQFALANGMQVLVIPDHRAPVATQMLWFKVGAVDDPPGISGLAHFFEHMMFRGTKTVPDDAFSQTIAKNGGETNAFTDHDYTAFYEQIATDRLPLAMRLEADRIANLDLSDANIGPERDVVLEERRMRVDNEPQSLMGEQMRAALHLSHPYGRPGIGWSDEVRRIDRISAQDFYDHHYAPNNAILVVAGGVSLDALEKAVDQVLGVNTLALPRDNDLARAKTQLIASVTYRRDSQFALATAYGQALTIGLTVDDVNEWPARIRAVNAEGVRK